jgi:hypothetical protein
MTTSYHLRGNRDLAANLRGLASQQLAILRGRMKAGGLEQDVRVVTFSDGTRITCTSQYGLENVTIYVPPWLGDEGGTYIKKKEEEDVRFLKCIVRREPSGEIVYTSNEWPADTPTEPQFAPHHPIMHYSNHLQNLRSIALDDITLFTGFVWQGDWQFVFAATWMGRSLIPVTFLGPAYDFQNPNTGINGGFRHAGHKVDVWKETVEGKEEYRIGAQRAYGAHTLYVLTGSEITGVISSQAQGRSSEYWGVQAQWVRLIGYGKGVAYWGRGVDDQRNNWSGLSSSSKVTVDDHVAGTVEERSTKVGAVQSGATIFAYWDEVARELNVWTIQKMPDETVGGGFNAWIGTSLGGIFNRLGEGDYSGIGCSYYEFSSSYWSTWKCPTWSGGAGDGTPDGFLPRKGKIYEDTEVEVPVSAQGSTHTFLIRYAMCGCSVVPDEDNPHEWGGCVSHVNHYRTRWGPGEQKHAGDLLLLVFKGPDSQSTGFGTGGGFTIEAGTTYRVNTCGSRNRCSGAWWISGEYFCQGGCSPQYGDLGLYSDHYTTGPHPAFPGDPGAGWAMSASICRFGYPYSSCVGVIDEKDFSDMRHSEKRGLYGHVTQFSYWCKEYWNGGENYCQKVLRNEGRIGGLQSSYQPMAMYLPDFKVGEFNSGGGYNDETNQYVFFQKLKITEEIEDVRDATTHQLISRRRSNSHGQ